MAMVNQIINPLHVKDSRWLTLEVCREFTRQKCTRSDQECKFAHPPPHVEVQNGRVTCCFDSIKGKCQRKDPPCKYLHPPQHLREQLLQNGRNNLILKNLQMQAMAVGLQPMVPGMVPPTMNGGTHLYSPQYPLQNGGSHLYSPSYSIQSPYLTSMHNTAPFNPYMGHASMNVSGMIQQVDTGTTVSPGSAQMSVMAGSGVQAAKVSRADRLEPASSTTASVSEGSTWSGAGSYADSIAPSSQYSQLYFQAHRPYPMPGVPLYVPGPVAGHPPSVQRF